MKVRLNHDRCAGIGRCVATCPDVFTFTVERFAEVTVEDIPNSFTEIIGQVAAQCPMRAITVMPD